MVLDQNGIEIVSGQFVIVHQDDGDHSARVIEPFEDWPTVNEPAHWVDIDKGEGVEEMMSYILEVLDLNDRLMATAPELLAVCRAVYEEMCRWPDQEGPLKRRVYEAIEKAAGPMKPLGEQS